MLIMVYDLEHDTELNEVVGHLIEEYGAERVILYGSRANGFVHEDSDTDLVVIKRTSKPFFDRLAEVAKVCKWTRAFEVLVYTPEEFANLKRDNEFIREEVLAKGKVLYDRAA
jgi:predicted nucleotidyltransferase